MKTIVEVIAVEKRVSKTGGQFYLSTILCDDQEEYTVAHSAPARQGDEVRTFFDDKYGKPKAVYPKP